MTSESGAHAAPGNSPGANVLHVAPVRLRQPKHLQLHALVVRVVVAHWAGGRGDQANGTLDVDNGTSRQQRRLWQQQQGSMREEKDTGRKHAAGGSHGNHSSTGGTTAAAAQQRK